MEITISKSFNKNRKYDAKIVNNKRTVAFGEKGASDYTKHKDKERKERYMDRHKYIYIYIYIKKKRTGGLLV